MGKKYEMVKTDLKKSPRHWLVTGAAGFIGSNLLEALLMLDQTVIGLDNFATGHQSNLDEVQDSVGADRWQNFRFIEGDICDLDTCHQAVEGVDYVLHQAALGSVPRSIENPVATNAVNINGFLNMLVAARDANVGSFTYAASSSTYGDHEALPKSEDIIGNPLSPYAITKYVNELYASVFARNYGFQCIGLRYFNIFGNRQDPNGAYAAVIPKWINSMFHNEELSIYGDGQTSRDFCYIDNAVQANIMAATASGSAVDEIYNIAYSARTSLNELFALLKDQLDKHGYVYDKNPVYTDFRAGDVMHSEADISKAAHFLGYEPSHSLSQGIEDVIASYVATIGTDAKMNGNRVDSELNPADIALKEKDANGASRSGNVHEVKFG